MSTSLLPQRTAEIRGDRDQLFISMKESMKKNILHGSKRQFF